MDFVPFPKIARLSRDCTVTEKIDGTNGQVHIRPDIPGNSDAFEFGIDTLIVVDGVVPALIRAGSRSRWLTQGGKEDNFGFGAWVYQHAHELAKLGFGHHFGEWWGPGIQRGYGLAERYFSLFNTSKWADEAVRPACCRVVPTLYEGKFTTFYVCEALLHLTAHGSVVSPGFMDPEGVIIYHHGAQLYFKKTIEKDDEPKNLHHLRAEGLAPRSPKARPYNPSTTGRRKGCEDYVGHDRRGTQ